MIKIDAKYKGEMPKYESEQAAAIDLRATRNIILGPDEVYLMPTGLHVDMSRHGNIAALLLPRSGAGHKGLVLGNLTGLIDPDYQGEIKASLWNRSAQPIIVEKGQRVAQLMFIPFVKVELRQVGWFEDDTKRGEKGFGGTGVI